MVEDFGKRALSGRVHHVVRSVTALMVDSRDFYSVARRHMDT